MSITFIFVDKFDAATHGAARRDYLKANLELDPAILARFRWLND